MTLGIIIGVVALVFLLVMLTRISNLVDIVRGNKGEVDTASFNGWLFLLLFVGMMAGFLYLNDFASEGFLPEPSSEHGESWEMTWTLTLYVMIAVFVVVNFFLFYFAFQYRGKKGAKVYFYAHNDKLELVWTVIPAIVLASLVLFGWKVWSDITQAPPENAITMEVVGKQFNWIVRHPGRDGKLGNYNYRKIDALNQLGIDYTDKQAFDDVIPQELVIPVGQPVNLQIRSRDVLHDVFLPHFRIKMDAVPGMVNNIWFTPIKTTADMRAELNNPEFEYEIVCNQICGSGHFGMAGRLKVVTQEEYQVWLAEQESFLKRNQEDLLEQVPENLRDLALSQLKDETVALNQ